MYSAFASFKFYSVYNPDRQLRCGKVIFKNGNDATNSAPDKETDGLCCQTRPLKYKTNCHASSRPLLGLYLVLQNLLHINHDMQADGEMLRAISNNLSEIHLLNRSRSHQICLWNCTIALNFNSTIGNCTSELTLEFQSYAILPPDLN